MCMFGGITNDAILEVARVDIEAQVNMLLQLFPGFIVYHTLGPIQKRNTWLRVYCSSYTSTK